MIVAIDGPAGTGKGSNQEHFRDRGEPGGSVDEHPEPDKVGLSGIGRTKRSGNAGDAG